MIQLGIVEFTRNILLDLRIAIQFNIFMSHLSMILIFVQY